MFDVFVVWLLLSIISTLILIIFATPFIYLFAGLFFSSVSAAGTADAGAMALFFIYLQTNLGMVVATGIIAVIGMDISQVFTIKATTEFYLQLKKKFPSILKIFSKKIGNFF